MSFGLSRVQRLCFMLVLAAAINVLMIAPLGHVQTAVAVVSAEGEAAFASDDVQSRTIEFPTGKGGNYQHTAYVELAEAESASAEMAAQGSADIEGAREAIRRGIENNEQLIDIVEYGLTMEEASDIYYDVVFANPQFFYVWAQCSVRYSSDNVAHEILPMYLDISSDELAEQKAKYEAALQDLLSWVPADASNADKVKAVHDWLVRNCEYKNTGWTVTTMEGSSSLKGSGFEPWTAYGALVEGYPVCQGYSLAFIAAMNELGFDSSYVHQKDHGWNRVCVDGKWYNVDITFDDPLVNGRDTGFDATPSTEYFMKSDAWFKAHPVNGVHTAWEPEGVAGTDTTYDEYNWKAFSRPANSDPDSPTDADGDEPSGKPDGSDAGTDDPSSGDSSDEPEGGEGAENPGDGDEGSESDDGQETPDVDDPEQPGGSSDDETGKGGSDEPGAGDEPGSGQETPADEGDGKTTEDPEQPAGTDDDPAPGSTEDPSGQTDTDDPQGGSDNPDSGEQGETVSPGDELDRPVGVVRLAGPIALDTMESIVSKGQFNKQGTVVLATFDGYWDALTAAGVAGLAKAPVLMTEPGQLSSQTKRILAQLAPKTIVVCGGKLALPETTVQAAAAAAGGATVKRCAGATATGTAVDIFTEAPKTTGGAWEKTAFVCTNDGYWDALAAAPVSYAEHLPIFLTEGRDDISSETLSAMKLGGIERVYIVGGPVAISESVGAKISASGIKVAARFGGATAVETSELVAEYGVSLGMTADSLGVATTNGYWDALSGAALCGRLSSVMILVDGAKANSITGFAKPNAADIDGAYVFGGPAAIDEATFRALKTATNL